MATKAKVIRNFFKKFFNLDVSGMSEVSALRDVFKKKYDIDVTGSSVVEILQNVIEAVDNLPSDGGSEYRDAYIALAERHSPSKTLILPEGPTRIGYQGTSWFDDGNPAVLNIVVPEGVTVVGNCAFEGCSFLESIDLPSTVTSIGGKALDGCDELRSITIRATEPPFAGASAFTGIPNDAIIYVPAESVQVYKAARNWSTRAAYIQAIPAEST